MLTGRLRLTKRLVQEFVESVLGVEVALGSICKLERSMSAALRAPVEEAREYVREAASVNADETGWREKLKKAWLWVAATALVVVFAIHRERSGKAARQLLGEDFVGFLGSDRWSPPTTGPSVRCVPPSACARAAPARTAPKAAATSSGC